MRTERIYIAAIILNVLIALQAYSPDVRAADMKNEEAVAAEIGGEKVLQADVIELLNAQKLSDISAGRLDSFVPDAKAKLLADLVDVKLFSLGARGNAIDERPYIKRRIKNMTDQLLAQEFITVFAENVPFSEAAMREYYDTRHDEFMGLDRIRARHIVVKTRDEAEKLIGELNKGAGFAELAKENNIDSTKQSGGELGWVVRGIMVKPFEDALLTLKPGETSQVVETFMGFHIIKVEEIQPGQMPGFESVKENIREKIKAARVRNLRDELIKKHPVKINKDVFGKTD